MKTNELGAVVPQGVPHLKGPGAYAPLPMQRVDAAVGDIGLRSHNSESAPCARSFSTSAQLTRRPCESSYKKGPP